ncbi:MAG: flagellar hook-basal body complex protein FliE [Solirubrobacteraceae bacterium]
MIIPPVGGLGVQLSVGQAEGLTHNGQSSGAGAAAGGESSGFGGELTEAISSLEKTQDSASSASQALATGKVSDPESAVVTVQDAQLAMELASQVRNKVVEATQNIFQTQV